MTPQLEGGGPPEPMRRATAQRRLLASLDAIGFRSGTIQLVGALAEKTSSA